MVVSAACGSGEEPAKRGPDTGSVAAAGAGGAAGIDQRTVAGGVLVQTSVKATAAGVLATVHPTDPTDERNYTINAKSGLGIAVVDGRRCPRA
jgi:hypothetical protein